MLPGSPAIELAPPRSWFLLCHSIELALKAFLTLHGKSESELKLIGHDLKKLLDSAEKCGLKLTPYTYGEIEMLAKAHSRHWARYPTEESKRVFVIEQFESSAAELLQQVGKVIYPPLDMGA